MSYWGKLLGGMAGFAVFGPMGALFGAALGHAADEGVVGNVAGRLGNSMSFESARIAALLGKRDQMFAVGVTTLAAKLAKCDGVVNRLEIDAFKQAFPVPEGSLGDVGRLFDNARDSPEGYENIADHLGLAFADNRTVLEQVMGGLHHIARADGPTNNKEAAFLDRVARGFGLDRESAARFGSSSSARGSSGGRAVNQSKDDPYKILGIDRRATNEAVRARWMVLMRENHPDSLASQGVPPHIIAAASDRVARINAAYDTIKRDRRL